MAFAYTIQERADLNAKASALLNTYPDVGSFIRQGLCGNPDTEALVYLRTALDPAPVITKAGDMLGLLYAARRWLRRNGIGPGRHHFSIRAQLHGHLDRLLGIDERGRCAAVKSSVHKRGDCRTGQRGQGQDASDTTARHSWGAL